MTTIPTNFFVVPAPGHYGDACVVCSSHRTIAAARRAAARGEIVRAGALEKGAPFLRVYEETYREV